MKPLTRTLVAALFAGLFAAAPAAALEMQETPWFAQQVADGALPPVAERAPVEPLVVDFESRGRTIGTQGGEIRTLIARAKDVRYAVVYGYARLVGYDQDFELKPDILKSVDVKEGRVFTLHLRKGHKWSNGDPFTSEDFRYWWEDVANNPLLSPSGPPELMIVGDAPPEFVVIDETTVQYAWPTPNPRFLPALAAARPPFIYRPAKYLKQFHADYADPAALEALVAENAVRNWPQLHNRLDNLYNFDNPDLPTLQPWVNTTPKNNSRYVLARNPYYHRVDPEGRQLPYVDTVEMTVAAGGLIPAKVNRGEADLQVRGLSFSDAPVLKKGEAEGGYTTYLWTNGAGADIALYPNQTVNDPVWRDLMRNMDFRRALSFAINREAINKSIYFGLARPTNVAALPESPLYNEDFAYAYANLDRQAANDLLDQVGLGQRDSDGWRLLPDGRRAELIVETAGERLEESDALELVQEMWKDVGLKMIFRPLDRDILRNRAYAGESMMPVWYGWDNGVPTPDASPAALAPVEQTNFSWPAWGQYFQTSGGAGEPPATKPAKRLLALFERWSSATTTSEKNAIWMEMLEIQANQVMAIGLVSGAPQPIAVSKRLRNFTESGVYAWEPAAHLGAYRIDELYYAE
ncbi:ABC transporter substrate-binding protein [Pikeienuella sp. HZG-20]|uniref:ABC transporter substrate-binding protein n=1 Tax=Paludibacillus litoralis TaxID=3133267 RepID=UPI0030EDCDBF